jgi:hypothetical protein
MSIARKLRGVDKALKSATNRALNRAVSSARSKLMQGLRAGTGLPTKDLKSRVKMLRASSKRQDVALLVGTKVGIPLRKFRAKAKSMRVTHRNRKGRTKHYGATVKIGQGGRQLAPEGFLMNTPSGTPVVAKRKVQSDPRSKTAELRTKVFAEVAEATKGDVAKHMQDTFEKNVSHEIEYALKKKFSTKE